MSDIHSRKPAESANPNIAEGMPPRAPMREETGEDATDIRQRAPNALEVFFAWEKLRVVYNYVLLMVVAIVAGVATMDLLPNLIELAIAANLLFCSGSVVENYIACCGIRRRPVRWVLFCIGMMLSIYYAVFVTQRIMRRLPVWPGFPEGLDQGL